MWGSVFIMLMLYKVVINFESVCPLKRNLSSTRLHKVVLTLKSVDETLVCDIQMKAIEQYFHVVLFIMLHLTFKSGLWMKR